MIVADILPPYTDPAPHTAPQRRNGVRERKAQIAKKAEALFSQRLPRHVIDMGYPRIHLFFEECEILRMLKAANLARMELAAQRVFDLYGIPLETLLPEETAADVGR